MTDRGGDRFRPITPIKSDFDRLMDDEGGAAGISNNISEAFLAGCAARIPFRRLADWLDDLRVERPAARRHWPWIAAVGELYEFETRRYAGDVRKGDRARRQDPLQDMKPSEIRESFDKVRSLADALGRELSNLHGASALPHDPRYPLLREHQAALHQLLAQAVAGISSLDLVTEPRATLEIDRRYESFIRCLARLSVTAKAALKADVINTDALTKKVGSRDKALPLLVSRAAAIWESMTPRKASVNKTPAKGTPDFVVFVQRIAGLATDSEPTFSQVASAFSTLKAARK